MKTRLFCTVLVVSLLFCLFGSSASASEPAAVQEGAVSVPEQTGGISLKYPVVLVHGIALRDTANTFNSWGKIPDVLRERGVDVYFGNTDAWGAIESNAEILKASVDRILEETGKEKVNIIAHSKGGLDSRLMIWKYDYGDKVASLTTISTPHHGSVVADIILTLKTLHTKAAKRSLMDLGRLYEDAYPDPYTAGYDLTTANMKEFNRIVTMDNRVYYHSIYSIMSKASDDPIFAASYKYIKTVVGDNDGLVSEYSARWGDNVTKIDGGISHGQIIDIMGQRLFEIDMTLNSSLELKVFDVYIGIVNDLSARGF